MWYFSWILGLACAFAILNALWLEIHLGDAGGEPPGGERPEERRTR